VSKSTGFPATASTALTSIVTNDVVWAVGNDNQTSYSISVSTDGGNSWINHATSSFAATEQINGISAISATTCLCLCVFYSY